ncbi:hypothetical protein AB0368_38140 [Actinoplanes sp. NPDC051475]|uniref:hypothetical protein n=1 Tax=Actinoplanes sp. NPDC051475 TaxID=3157225 RepID=UPI0034507BB0
MIATRTAFPHNIPTLRVAADAPFGPEKLCIWDGRATEAVTAYVVLAAGDVLTWKSWPPPTCCGATCPTSRCGWSTSST